MDDGYIFGIQHPIESLDLAGVKPGYREGLMLSEMSCLFSQQGLPQFQQAIVFGFHDFFERLVHLPVGHLVKQQVYAQAGIFGPLGHLVGIEGNGHLVAPHLVDHARHAGRLLIIVHIGKETHNLARLKHMRPVDFGGTVELDDDLLSHAVFLAGKGDRIPAKAVFFTLLQRSVEHFLAIIFKIGFFFQLQQIGYFSEFFSRFSHKDAKIHESRITKGSTGLICFS